MENVNTKETFQIRSFTDRRKVKDRRSFLNQENTDYNPGKRVNTTRRQTFADRRSWFSKIM